MHVEVSVALNFMISYLYNRLPRRRVDMFGEELEKGLKKKFEEHWYPEKPFKGSAYRCIRVGEEKIDPVLIYAAEESGLNIDEIQDYLPKELTLWIDPCEVSYRIGEKGVVKILFSEKRGPLIPVCHGSGSNSDDDAFESLDKEIQAASKGFNPEAQSFKPIDSLSSSLTNLSISPSSPTPSSGWSTTSTSPVAGLYNKPITPVNTFLPPKPHHAPNFTAATFAATKFGSTKLQSQAKRPSRLSPTEIGAYIKQRATPVTHGPAPVPFVGHQPPQQGHQPPQQHQHHNPRPRTHSPREPRPDFLEHQRMLYLQQQQQQQQQQQLQHQQQHTAALLSPLGGTVNDILSHHSQQPMGFSDLLGPGRATVMQSMPSPDGPNKAFMDGFSMNTMPPYTNQLQHLLVAN